MSAASAHYRLDPDLTVARCFTGERTESYTRTITFWGREYTVPVVTLFYSYPAMPQDFPPAFFTKAPSGYPGGAPGSIGVLAHDTKTSMSKLWKGGAGSRGLEGYSYERDVAFTADPPLLYDYPIPTSVPPGDDYSGGGLTSGVDFRWAGAASDFAGGPLDVYLAMAYDKDPTCLAYLQELQQVRSRVIATSQATAAAQYAVQGRQATEALFQAKVDAAEDIELIYRGGLVVKDPANVRRRRDPECRMRELRGDLQHGSRGDPAEDPLQVELVIGYASYVVNPQRSTPTDVSLADARVIDAPKVCGLTTYAGCCRDGACMPGNELGACGAGGGVCSSCTTACLRGGCTPCTPGKVETQPCGNCGTTSRTCGFDGAWGSYGECASQGECTPGDKIWIGCGACGRYRNDCDSSCQWTRATTCQSQCGTQCPNTCVCDTLPDSICASPCCP
jgi:hypothetical protein